MIDSALAHSQPAVVHLPNGKYLIDETLSIPAGSDLMFLGNGQTTRIEWAGAAGGTILEIDGHQVDGVTVRDLGLHGGGTANAIRAFDINQENSRVLLNKVSVSHPSIADGQAGIVVDRCDRTEVVLTDSGLDGVLNSAGMTA